MMSFRPLVFGMKAGNMLGTLEMLYLMSYIYIYIYGEKFLTIYLYIYI